MKTKHLKSFAGLLLASLVSGSACAATTIISDNYTTANTNSGFALGEGVNSSIGPSATRITGTAAANLRYLQTDTRRSASRYDIGSNRLRVLTETTIGRFTLSANGATPFDFGPALGATYASPTNRATYDIKISLRNDATSTARFSFGLATAEGDVTVWDFGVQLYRTSGTIDFYTMQKRIDTASAGVADVNTVMGTTGPNTTNSPIPFLIRVTDAGAESNSYTSQVQVSLDNGVTWIYDTATNTVELPSGFRFDGPGRYLIFDQASNGSGNVFYDSLSVVSSYSPAPPAARIWTGGGTNDSWSTPENWGGTAPSNGEPLVFEGGLQTVNSNDLNGLEVPTVSFNNGAFSLFGNPFLINSAISNLAGANTLAGDLSFGTTSLKTWNIAGGSELVLSNLTTIEVNGDHGMLGGGTLQTKGTLNIGQATTANPAFSIFEGQHIVNGGTFASRGGYRIGSQATGVGAQTILTNGAIFNLTTSGGNLRVGDSANPNASQLLLHNSTLTMTGGNLGIPYAAGATGMVSQVGGTVSGGIIAFNDNGAGSGLYQIVNGTLEPLQIRDDTAAGSSAIYFDNAILRTAAGANSNFFSGVDLAEIQAGGLTLDVSADVAIAQVLSGSGVLTKSGSASATLTGANTYSGNTIVQAGKLFLPTIQTNATAVQVADGAEFGANVRTPGSTLSVASLSYDGTGALNFNLGSFPTPAAPLLRVSSLSANGAVAIHVMNGLQLTTGQIVLVDYSGSIGGGFNHFTIGSLPPGVTATLVNNTANSSIDLNITGVPGLRWTGAANSEWDGGTPNWLNLQDSSASAFFDGVPTEFLDGAATGNINIPGFPAPALLTVSNHTLPYIWSGGAVTVPTLKKFGTNSLTRVEGSSVDLIQTIELNAGSFVASNLFDATLSSILTDTTAGTGTFVKQGGSTLTISSNSPTYDGAFLVQEGVVKLANSGALGSTNGRTTIASGATLDVNDIAVPHEPVIVSGPGVNGAGAIIDSTTGTAVAHNLTDVTMMGDTTFGVPNGGRLDIRVRSSTGPGPGLRGNGFNLIKVGSGSLSIACQRNIGVNTPYWQMDLGDVFINEGSLTFAESLSLGNPSKTITVAPGATLGTFDLNMTNPIVRRVIMTNATITSSGGTGDTNPFSGPIQISGTAHLRPLDTKLVVNGVISGNGGVAISANAAGEVYLNGVNTYTGDTTVTNGVLGGNGVIPGNLFLSGGLTPGMGVGTLTVNGNADLMGNTQMELNRSVSPNCDRLVVNGLLSFGGGLNVILAPGAPSPQAGDVYQLFSKGSGSSFVFVNLPDLSALPGNLAWNTNNLNANGSIAVTGSAAPPAISSVSTSGGHLIFNGTGGIAGNNYIVLTSTNVALPLASWTPVSTNAFGPGGSFSVTNAIQPSSPASFFTVKIP